jgi:hypothetical protein
MNHNLKKQYQAKFPTFGYSSTTIARRKADGSNQWQDGYPNPEVIQMILLKMLDMCYSKMKTL